MATTLPSYTKTVDDEFVSTWYEIREEAIDNILSSTLTWNILVAAGCLTPQVGGDIITRTIQYGTTDAENVAKGSVMASGEPDIDTMAWWQWKYIAVNVQRSTFDDQKNAGPAKIKDYVGRRITSARDGLEAKLETDIHTDFQSSETGTTMLGLNDMVPGISDSERIVGTYGNINRPASYDASGVEEPATGNTWWGPKYLDGTLASIDVDLLDDMKLLYNTLHNNQVPPNLIMTTQTIFETYETYGVDISQIIKDETTRLADLGFEVLRFKGKPIVYHGSMTANSVLFLNTDFIEMVYDPNLWFDMTDWKPTALEFDRAAQIILACSLISTQLRRHGRLVYA